MGVTPNGVAGSTKPSIRSATACAMTLAARVSVPVGKCGPCCSTLPHGRITSGFFFNCAAISGWVRSAKWRLGNMAIVLGQPLVRISDDVGDFHRAALLLDRAQPGVNHCQRDIGATGVEFVRFSAAATCGEHV